MKLLEKADMGHVVTYGECMAAYQKGLDCIWEDGKFLTTVENEKAYQDGHPSRHKTNISNKSISKNSSAIKHSYSVVCRSCGRKLTSEESRNRGYGSYCYRKAQMELLREANENEAEDMNFLEEIRRIN